MAEISSLLTLQGQLALLTLIGFFLARKGIINAQGRKCLTDLLINVILPANIIQSFLVEFSWDVLKSSASILVISLALQIGCVVLCALGYNWLPFAKRSVYQYGTVCSNGAPSVLPPSQGCGPGGRVYPLGSTPARIVPHR